MLQNKAGPIIGDDGWISDMKSLMKDFAKKPEVTKFWDAVQLEFSCCGVESYRDWSQEGVLDNPGAGNPYTRGDVPISCCLLNRRRVQNQTVPSCNWQMATAPVQKAEELIRTEGCIAKMSREMVRQVHTFAGILLGLSLFTTVAVLAACWLDKLRNRKHTRLSANSQDVKS